ncbi:MAG: hypothetical protein ISR58_20680 [Anaerolineales bacterium]|nr:hypothetical protein [Chloroflexota bacterium]MBL6983605.1 hypothetical protein [Anaerolineales bacterium]
MRANKPISPSLMIVVSMLILASLACNLPIFPGSQDAPPEIDDTPPQADSTPTTDVASQRATAAATDEGTEAEPAEAEPADSESAPPDIPDSGEPILAAEKPAIPDCNAFDINAFNGIIDGTFSFVMQDQLNNCHFESDNGFRLLIGGGKPSSSDEMYDLFNTSFGSLPESTWEYIDGYYLGLAYSSASVTVQGASTSGHSMVIVAASQPGSDPDALKQIFEALGREAAQQLNTQF